MERDAVPRERFCFRPKVERTLTLSKMVTSNSDGSVKGVQFQVNGRNLTASASKETILSAESVNIPKILMLSGFGPADELKKHNIPVRQALSVGLNLQDHYSAKVGMTFYKSTAQPLSNVDILDATFQYTINRTGMFAGIGASNFVGFISTVNDANYPDIEIENLYFPKQSTDALTEALRNFGYNDRIIEQFVAANAEAETIIWFLSQLHPKSRGKLRLRSSDPFDPPMIYPNYLANNEDLETCVRAIKIINTMSTTNTFKLNEGNG